MNDRYALIADKIKKVRNNEKDTWKRKYYEYAFEYIKGVEYFEGGSVCSYCRSRGLSEPHHHNVWGSMLPSLVKKGWIEKIGMVTPTTSHTHIDKVCQWKSNIFMAEADKHSEQKQGDLFDE